MALVNHAKHEINAKIVFCGASGAGKSTLLKTICSQLPAENRGQLKSTIFQQDRMLFFDFTHPDGSDSDKYSLRLHVYTLTGDVTQSNAWKMVLKGADGVAFVADSDPARQSANRLAFDQMLGALNANGKRLENLPAVVFCTKNDLPDPVSLEQLQSGLPVHNLALFPVDSLSGSDVMYPMAELLEKILAELEELGLDLQPQVHELCGVASARTQKAAAVIPPEPLIPEISIIGETIQDPGADAPLISLDGVPELSDDGSITVGLKVNCCGRISTAALKITILT